MPRTLHRATGSNAGGVAPEVHVMDYPTLNLGYPTASRKTVQIVDLDVHIWGLEEIAQSKLPIAVVVSALNFIGVACLHV